LLAILVLRNRSGWTSSIGVPIFSVWLLGMFMLWRSWLWLIESNSHFIFPLEEAVFSVILALISTLGLLLAACTGSNLRAGRRLALFGATLAAQVTAMFLSALGS
jgi:hypothetical protein